MSIFDRFTSQEDREIMARTVFLGGDEREIGRAFLPNPAQERLVKSHPGGIGEIEKQGEPRHFFRCGSLEFRTLLAAVKIALANLFSASPSVEAVTLEGELRPKCRNEILEEIVGTIKPLEDALIAKLTEKLSQPGPFREALICGNDISFEKRKHLEEEREDLKVRLNSIFGDDSNLLFAYWLRPEIFKRAVENLPQGKSEVELLAERKADAKEDLSRHRARIEEVRNFIKTLR